MKTQLILMMIMLGLSGCAMTGGSSDDAAEAEVSEEERVAAENEIKMAMAEIPKSSPLAKIELGMSDARVRDLIGSPNDSETYQTGKAWIPFYYGTDVARTEYIYRGEGRVVFSINRYSGQLKVINVLYDPKRDPL